MDITPLFDPESEGLHNQFSYALSQPVKEEAEDGVRFAAPQQEER